MLRKIAAVIIEDRKFVVVRDKGSNIYKMPGGKIDGKESDFECLKRELMEELKIIPLNSDFILTSIGKTASGQEIRIDFHLVKYKGRIKPSSEVEEFLLIDSKFSGNLIKNVREELIPKLLELGLID